MSTGTCQRPGCPGAYEDLGDGELSCDTCGYAPAVSADGTIGSPPTGVTGGGFTPTGVTPSGATAAGSAPPFSSPSRRSASARSWRTEPGRPDARPLSVRSSGSGAATGSSGRNRLGAGLVSVPDVPRPDPLTAVLKDPEVPERKRFCSRGDCGARVGRARGGRPGRTAGYCTACGHPYSFVPRLRPGDVVHGQYEIAGCLAHGGLGWIYLAIDRAVSNRWVVLKGLLNTGDEDAVAAAVSERRFLAEIEHANIVRIYNFVEHLDQRTGSLDGYIVMEYVGGKSLGDIANARRAPDGRRDPLPVEQACAYGLEALEALGHLHSRKLLYCDFKVDNAIQQQDRLKLIDMGAVRRMDDTESAVYGTVGYQAPEVVATGPSVASDLYTVARTLAVLTFDFQGHTNVFADSLPDPAGIEVFRRYESFYRLLARATDPDPGRRFASAEEMAEQLTGVLREVVALRTGRPRPALSTLFGPELRVPDTDVYADDPSAPVSALGDRRVTVGGRGARAGRRAGRKAERRAGRKTERTAGSSSRADMALERAARPSADMALERAGHGHPATPAPGPGLRPVDTAATALALPVPRVDPRDPNAGFLAGLMASAPHELLAALRNAPADSVERRLRELRAQLETGDTDAAARTLAEAEAWDPEEWRVVWYRGVVSLATGDHETAALSFDAVYDAFPGEPAPKLALAVCAEVLGQSDDAAEFYHLVWTTDPSHVSAAFGLARVRLAAGDRTGAVAALASVPESSIHCTAARVAGVRARLRHRSHQDPLLDDLTAAAEQVQWLGDFGLDAPRRERLTAEVLGCALDWLLTAHPTAAAPQDADSAVPPPPYSERADATATEPGRTRAREPVHGATGVADTGTGAAGPVEAGAGGVVEASAGRAVDTSAGGTCANGADTVAPRGDATDAANWFPGGQAARGAGAFGTGAEGGSRDAPRGLTLLGSSLDERGLRFGLERSYRALARLAQRGEERIELVERANRYRPRTWV